MRLLKRAALAFAVAFLSTGCWQSTDVHHSGRVLDFVVGAPKREVFDVAIRNQQDGKILNLQLLDALPGTYDDKYKGAPIDLADFQRVAASDDWHASLPGCNCWLRLIFREGTLHRIEEHEWTGPTE